MLNVINGSTEKPITSQTLREWLTSREGLDGTLYIGYPIIGTVDGAYEIDALLISPQLGVLAFNLIEGNKLLSLLKMYKMNASLYLSQN